MEEKQVYINKSFVVGAILFVVAVVLFISGFTVLNNQVIQLNARIDSMGTAQIIQHDPPIGYENTGVGSRDSMLYEFNYTLGKIDAQMTTYNLQAIMKAYTQGDKVTFVYKIDGEAAKEAEAIHQGNNVFVAELSIPSSKNWQISLQVNRGPTQLVEKLETIGSYSDVVIGRLGQPQLISMTSSKSEKGNPEIECEVMLLYSQSDEESWRIVEATAELYQNGKVIKTVPLTYNDQSDEKVEHYDSNYSGAGLYGSFEKIEITGQSGDEMHFAIRVKDSAGIQYVSNFNYGIINNGFYNSDTPQPEGEGFKVVK